MALPLQEKNLEIFIAAHLKQDTVDRVIMWTAQNMQDWGITCKIKARPNHSRVSRLWRKLGAVLLHASEHDVRVSALADNVYKGSNWSLVGHKVTNLWNCYNYNQPLVSSAIDHQGITIWPYHLFPHVKIGSAQSSTHSNSQDSNLFHSETDLHAFLVWLQMKLLRSQYTVSKSRWKSKSQNCLLGVRSRKLHQALWKKEKPCACPSSGVQLCTLNEPPVSFNCCSPNLHEWSTYKIAFALWKPSYGLKHANIKKCW